MHKVDTTWFRELGWGVFIHFLGEKGMSADEWNQRVDSYDVAGVAEQLEQVGAGYLIFTVGQCSGHFCAPNGTYDKLTGITPSKCSNRDLISDLYTELSARGIELLVYVPSEGPALDLEAYNALGAELHWSHETDFDYPENDNPRWARYRKPGYQKNWEAILKEWSLRWGNKVRGWWVDGAYGKMFRFPEAQEPNLKTFKDALTAGNPDAITAFNPGLEKELIGYSKHDDYTAGEFAWSLPEFNGPMVIAEGKEVQTHTLIYQGEGWCNPVPRFTDTLFTGYTEYVISKGGVITWDVGIEKSGLIAENNFRQLTLLKKIRIFTCP